MQKVSKPTADGESVGYKAAGLFFVCVVFLFCLLGFGWLVLCLVNFFFHL